MNWKILFVLFLNIFAVTYVFGQKAYESIAYAGKVAGLKVKVNLTIADGFIDASVLELVYADNTTRTKYEVKTEAFATIDTLKFVHPRFTDYFKIFYSQTGSPSKLRGVYFFKDSKYEVVLTKRR